jgi:hypothetical protein
MDGLSNPVEINKGFKQINQPDTTVSQVMSLNMFRAPPRPSSGAYNCSLWFYRWSVVVAVLLVVV